MKFIYEAIVAPSGSFYEAYFPDLDIITQGVSLADAAFMAQDLLENHIVLALQKGEELPSPTFGSAYPEGGYRLGVVVDCDADTPQKETMTVSEAASALGVSDARVRAMARDGILESHKVGSARLIDTESVIRRSASPVGPGRPSKETAAV